MSELSHFEAESAKTPKMQPFLIIGGSLFMVFAMWAINVFIPTDALDQVNKKKDEAAAAAAAPVAAPADDDDDDEE